MMIAHQNRFNTVSVSQPPQVLDGAVQGGDLPALHLGRVEDTGGGQLLPQRLGEVGHLVKREYAPVKPLEHLLGSERRLPQLLEIGGHLGQIHGFDVGHGVLSPPGLPGRLQSVFFCHRCQTLRWDGRWLLLPQKPGIVIRGRALPQREISPELIRLAPKPEGNTNRADNL